MHTPHTPSDEGVLLSAKCVSLYQSKAEHFRMDITDLSNRSVEVYDLSCLTCLRGLGVDLSNPRSAVFNEDGRFLAFVLGSALIALDRTADIRPLTAFASDVEIFGALKMHDMQGEVRLIAANKHSQIAILDLINKRALITLQTTFVPVNIAVCQDDTLLVASGDALLRWNLRELTSDPLQTVEPVANGATLINMAQSPDKTQIATVHTGSVCRLWDAQTLQELKSFQYSNRNTFLNFFSFIDSNRVLLREPMKKDIMVWDTENNQGVTNSLPEIFMSSKMGLACGNMIVGTPDGTIEIYDPGTVEKINTFKKVANVSADALASIGVFEDGVILM
jgi:WD40 repeat protein